MPNVYGAETIDSIKAYRKVSKQEADPSNYGAPKFGVQTLALQGLNIGVSAKSADLITN